MTFFSYISPGSLSIQSKSKIIPKSDFNNLLTSKEALEKALLEIEQKHAETEIECENLKKKATEEGFQQGLEEFNSHILTLDASAKKIYLDTQKVVLSLALTAAKKIVKKELETFPDTIVDIVSHALTPAKHNKRVSIYVNKADKEALEKEKPQLKELFEQIQVLSIQERSDVSPGGCIIETETGIINASIENQWKALELAFERYKH